MTTLRTVLFATAAAMFALVIAASFLPEQRLWGLNHLAFYPLSLRVLAFVAIALAFVPSVGTRIHDVCLAGIRKFRPGTRVAPVILVLLAFGSATLFSACQSSTLLLGDGQFVSNTVELLYEEGKPGVIESVRQINVNEHIAPGTYTLHYLAGLGARSVLGRPATDGIRRLNIFLGACFVLLFGLVLLHAPIPDILRLWLAVLVLTSGALQLFFGYVENYTPLFFVASLYMLAALSALYQGRARWPLVLIAAAAVWTHAEGVLLLPSVAFMLLWRRNQTQPKRLGMLAGVLSVIALAGAIAVKQLPSAQTYLLTLSGDSEYYGMFAPTHGLDLTNVLLLLVPSIVIFAVLAIVQWRDRSTDDDKTARWLVFLVVFPCLLYLVLFKAELGVARDWDLFAIVTVGIVPGLLLMIRRLHATDPGAARRLFAPVLVMSLVLTAGWIGVNASPDRTARRAQAILTYDTSRAGYAYETLAKHYHSHAQLNQAIATLETGASISKNPRHHLILSGYYREAGDLAGAETLLKRIVRDHPGNLDARRNLCLLLNEQNRLEELIGFAEAGVRQAPSDLGLLYMVGRAYLSVGRNVDGRAAFEHLLSLNPAAETRDHLNKVLRDLDRLEQQQLRQTP